MAEPISDEVLRKIVDVPVQIGGNGMGCVVNAVARERQDLARELLALRKAAMGLLRYTNTAEMTNDPWCGGDFAAWRSFSNPSDRVCYFCWAKSAWEDVGTARQAHEGDCPVKALRALLPREDGQRG